ncbi:MAG: hypothetical protein ACK4NZ_12350, partial [Tsuneonella sp.]
MVVQQPPYPSRTDPRVAADSHADLSAYALISPSFAELSVLLLVTIMGGIAILLEGFWLAALNMIIPITLMATMALGTLRSLQKSVATIWTPLIWIRA